MRAELTLADALRDAADRWPDRTALVIGEDRLRYDELLDRAARVAAWLRASFSSGERVAVWSPNRVEWLVLEWACALADVVLVTVNPAFRAREASQVLEDAGVVAVFHSSRYRDNDLARMLADIVATLPAVRRLIDLSDVSRLVAAESSAASVGWAGPTPASVAHVQFTSGTTGRPKGVQLRHGAMIANTSLAIERMEVTGDDVWVNPNPFFHLGGCVLSTIGPTLVGATQVAMEAFDADLWLDLLVREKGTMTGGVPTMYVRMLDAVAAGAAAPSLRAVMSGGSVVPPDLVRRIESALGARFTIAFGQTESSGHLTQSFLDDTPEDKGLTVGTALPGTTVAVVDGEIVAKSDILMVGYLDGSGFDDDGWLHTGDLGTVDERGYVRITGRMRDVINRGGEKVVPREVEDVLDRHPAVAEVCVVGVPDDHWGEQVAAFVRLNDGSTSASVAEEELAEFLRPHVAPHKVPRHWRFVDELPTTASGKVQRFVLRDRWVEEQ